MGTCEITPGAYWEVGGRCISKVDFLYLSTPTRLTGLLLGAALAMVWRPGALMRGPMRHRARLLDVGALLGLVRVGGAVLVVAHRRCLPGSCCVGWRRCC